jgi:class 3 adenylate cyclase
MAEPQIRYTKTADGVSIAFWTLGDGPHVVFLPPSPHHVQLDWQFDSQRRFYEWLSSRRCLIRFDARNTGLSDRSVEDVSTTARQLDLDAVLDRLAVERFAMIAMGFTDLPLAYAASHPDRVQRLVLINVLAAPRPGSGPPALAAMPALLEADWEAFTETVAGMTWGWDASGQARQQAELYRQSQTWEDAKRFFAQPPLPVEDLLPNVGCPTLIVQARDAIVTNVDAGRALAAGIEGARLLTTESRAVRASWEDPAVRAAIDGFLDEGSDTPPARAEMKRAGAGVTAVLVTDLVGHTEMMQRLGDDRGRAVLREHERITRDLLKQHGGAEVKTMGDGFMASFASVTKAMDCAIALQRAFAAHEGEPLQVRVGLNAGEPIEEDGDLFGSTVIMASRIAAKAGTGEILIPEPLRHLLTGKSYVYTDRGETMLKGFEDAVRLYEVRWRD